MIIQTSAIICAVRAHGEHGAIVRASTSSHGLLGGYVRGARSRTMRPILIPGNLVAAEFRVRSESQLASLSVELVHSRAPLLREPLAAAGIDWTCALAAAVFAEGHPYPALHTGLDGVLAAIEVAPSARGWAAALALFESLILSELGYGGRESAGVDVTDWPAILAALTANGARLERHMFGGRRATILEARLRLIDRLKRAVA